MGCCSTKVEDSSTDVTFLALSDIHLDPCQGLSEGTEADFAQLMKHLVQLDASEWPAYLRSRCGPPTPSGSRKDSNFSLLEAVLDHAKEMLPQPAFIIYPGDFLKHDIWELPTRARMCEEDGKTFFRKTVEVVMQSLTTRFPNVPVFVTFGNDDSYVGDYALTYKGQLLADLKPTMKRAIGPSTLSFDGEHAFLDTGSYSATLPTLGHRLISLSNIWFSKMVGKECCPHPTEPGARCVLAFLDAELGEAARRGQRVWLLMHIPGGHTGFLKPNLKTWSVCDQWHASTLAAFQRVLDSHDVPIDWLFLGHTHMNDYRIMTHRRNGVAHPLIGKIVPGVSPLFGQNPGFQIYSTVSGAVSGWRTHYLNHDQEWGTFEDNFPSVEPAKLLAYFEKMHATGIGDEMYTKHFWDDTTLGPTGVGHTATANLPFTRDHLVSVLELAPAKSAFTADQYEKEHVTIEVAMLASQAPQPLLTVD